MSQTLHEILDTISDHMAEMSNYKGTETNLYIEKIKDECDLFFLSLHYNENELNRFIHSFVKYILTFCKSEISFVDYHFNRLINNIALVANRMDEPDIRFLMKFDDDDFRKGFLL